MRDNIALCFALGLTSCTSPQQRQAEAAAVEAQDPCRQAADDAYWKVVDSCDERGLKYDDCSELPAAEDKMRKDYEACP